MKTCSRCGQTKPSADFHAKTADRKQCFCKECAKLYLKEHYRKNASTYKQKAKAHKHKLVDLINQLKDGPCTDCGKRYPPYVMDFDHRDPSQKMYNIAAMVRQHGLALEKIKDEITKCDLVCSNCHRERTHSRMLCSSNG